MEVGRLSWDARRGISYFEFNPSFPGGNLDPFLTQNMYYNADEDYYVCPMGQHIEHIGDVKSRSELGYEPTVSKYSAQNCTGCPLRGICYKGMSDCRTIEVNHQANAYRAEA